MNNNEKNKCPVTNLYVLEDKVTGRFYPPFDAANHDDAIRKFRQMFSAPNSMIAQEPEMWCIHWVGDFDQGDAQIDLLDSPKFVCDATNFGESETSKNFNHV